MKATDKQQLAFLSRDVSPLVIAVVDGYDYDMGDSDLDDEQPITVRMSLGDYRRAVRLNAQLDKVEDRPAETSAEEPDADPDADQFDDGDAKYDMSVEGELERNDL